MSFRSSGTSSTGAATRDIAERLVISPKTVGTHVEHILQKLDVHSRAQAVARAHREGLAPIEGPVPIAV